MPPVARTFRHAAALFAVVVLAGCAVGSPAGGSEPSARAGASSIAATSPPDRLPPLDPGTSLVAQAVTGAADVFPTPTGGRRSAHLTSPTPGSPLVFQVVDGQADRIQVRLPVRPDGSTGWVDRAAVHMLTDDWQLVVTPDAHVLRVLRAGRLVETDPVGIGRGVSPTPAGSYYITELLRPPDPAGSYGPYAFGLSAYSPTLTEFAGGTGQIGLHGTNDPAGLGHDVSHGCIRVANVVITRLARELPLGTPVEIRAAPTQTGAPSSRGTESTGKG
ncbi:MAG: L,D-transpeptidase [Frankia sp.]